MNGYGYANPLFYPDLFIYIPALLAYLGLNLITSYKIFLLLITFFSVLSMYITVNKITKNSKAAIISAVLYCFSSYRLTDVFTRAALGESLSFIFAPIVLYGFYEIIYRDYKKYYILIIGMTGLILSHIISSYLMFFLLFLILLINIKKILKQPIRIKYLSLATLITILLTSYFLLPMLEQMFSNKFVFNNINNSNILQARALPFYSVFISIPYYSLPFKPPGIDISFILFIYIFFKNYKNISKFTKLCFFLSFFLLFCTTSLFPWKWFTNIFSVVQFPWRFYFLTSVLLCIGSGILYSEIKYDFNKILCKILFFSTFTLLLITGLNLLLGVVKESDMSNKYYISYGEYLPQKVDTKHIMERGDIVISSSPIEYKVIREENNLIIEFNKNLEANKLELPLLYYKGYTVLLNEKNIINYQTKNGLIGIDIDNIESGTIKVYYHGTCIQRFSLILSKITFGLLLIIIIRKQIKNAINKKKIN